MTWSVDSAKIKVVDIKFLFYPPNHCPTATMGGGTRYHHALDRHSIKLENDKLNTNNWLEGQNVKNQHLQPPMQKVIQEGSSVDAKTSGVKTVGE